MVFLFQLVLAILSGIMIAFGFQHSWNWHIVPTFEMHALSLAQAYVVVQFLGWTRFTNDVHAAGYRLKLITDLDENTRPAVLTVMVMITSLAYLGINYLTYLVLNSYL